MAPTISDYRTLATIDYQRLSPARPGAGRGSVFPFSLPVPLPPPVQVSTTPGPGSWPRVPAPGPAAAAGGGPIPAGWRVTAAACACGGQWRPLWRVMGLIGINTLSKHIGPCRASVAVSGLVPCKRSAVILAAWAGCYGRKNRPGKNSRVRFICLFWLVLVALGPAAIKLLLISLYFPLYQMK